MNESIKYLSDIPSKYTHKDYLADLAAQAKEDHSKKISEWLHANPEIGSLNTGKFYVYPVDGEYREVQALEAI